MTIADLYHHLFTLRVSGQVLSPRREAMLVALSTDSRSDADKDVLQNGYPVPRREIAVCSYTGEAAYKPLLARVYKTNDRNGDYLLLRRNRRTPSGIIHCGTSGDLFEVSDDLVVAVGPGGDTHVPYETEGYVLTPYKHRHIGIAAWVRPDRFDYHHGPRLWRRPEPGDYGVELELLTRQSSKRSVVAASAFANGLCCERDGSLDDACGVEIIGPPMPYSEYIGNNGWRRFIDESQELVRGWDAGTGYGMHVSVNAAQFTSLLINKILVAGNLFKTLGQFVAGRNETRYARYFVTSWLSVPEETDKYLAVALRPGLRLEFRMFRSTIRYDRFIRNIQYAKSICDFCIVSGIKQLTQPDYLAWISKNQHHYQELVSYLYTSSSFASFMDAPGKKTISFILPSSVPGDNPTKYPTPEERRGAHVLASS